MRYLRSFSLTGCLLGLMVAGVSACGSEPATSGSTAAGGSSTGTTTMGTSSGGGGSSMGGAGGTSTGGKGGSTGGAGGATAGSAGTTGGSTTGGAGGATGGMGGSSGGAGTGGAVVHIEAPCGNHTYACGDTIDNDGDGLIDSDDPDCLGPCDNTEGDFYGGIPGQPGSPCNVDCYWDADSGPGNDDCYWTHRCDPNELTDPGHPEPNATCPYDPSATVPGGGGATCDQLLQMQSQTCATVCGPLTPNGCDCFGCCELPSGSGKYVWLGSEEPTGTGSCSIAVLDDPTKCEPCIPVPACLNTCEHCELCIGKNMLPPDCFPSGSSSSSTGVGGSTSSSSSTTGQGGSTTSSSSTTTGTGGTGGSTGQCPPGIQACGLPGQAPCPVDYYCITGCCQYIKPPG